MTLRELLKSLHAVDEKHLDVHVLVSPASGGYAGISHVSALYVGRAVIHLAESKPEGPPPDFWKFPEGGVAAVDPDDMKKLWQLFRDVQSRSGGIEGGVAIDMRLYERACSPGADVQAVWFRAAILETLKQLRPELLAPWIHDGEFDDAVFQVAATFPMEKMRTGAVREGLPFDVEEFVKRIGARS